MKPDNDTLMAFADGALPDEDMKQIAQLIEQDEQLAAIVDQHRALRRTVQAAYQAGGDAPMSPRLAELMTSIEQEIGSPNVTSLADQRRRRMAGRSASYWPLAAAACLVIGIMGGLLAPSISNNGPAKSYIAWQEGAPVASKPLARALSTQPAGRMEDQPVAIMASFIADAGTYCRQFDISGRKAMGGIACKADKAWQIIALNTRPASGHYQAAGDAPDPLAAAALQLGLKKKLSPEEEAEQISIGWIPQD